MQSIHAALSEFQTVLKTADQSYKEAKRREPGGKPLTIRMQACFPSMKPFVMALGARISYLWEKSTITLFTSTLSLHSSHVPPAPVLEKHLEISPLPKPQDLLLHSPDPTDLLCSWRGGANSWGYPNGWAPRAPKASSEDLALWGKLR